MPELTEHERLILIEHDVRAIRESLNNGAKKFTQIDDKLSQFDDQLRPTITKVIGWAFAFITAIGIPIGIFMYQLGKYPDAGSFVQARADYQATQKALETRVQALEVSRAEQEIRLRTISDTLGRVETKLDTALNDRRRRP